VSKIVCIFLIAFFISGCAGPTKPTYQELPKEKPLAIKTNGVTLRLISFGYTKNWSGLEVAIANETDEEIYFDATQVFLTNEKGYDLIPLKSYEINERVHRKTGKWITPLTVGAIATGIAAIIAPSSQDRTTFARAALALAGAAGTAELAKRQTAEADIERKEDLLLKSYKIPPHLQLGGVLYYRAAEGIKGVKAFITVKGTEEFFHIEL
jgi:hypothetical protein